MSSAVTVPAPLFLDGGVDLAPLRPLEDLPGEALVVGLEPRSDGRREVRRVPDHLLGRAARRHGDDVVGLDLVARDVHATAVHVEVAVADELAGLGARRGGTRGGRRKTG